MENEPLFITFLKNPTDPFINRLIDFPDKDLEKLLKVDLELDLGPGWDPPYVYEEKVYMASVIKENSDNNEVNQLLDKASKK